MTGAGGVFAFLIGGLSWWQWAVVAMLLLILELMVTTGWFIGPALAGLAVAVVVALVPTMGWPAQMLLFGALSLVGLGLAQLWFRHRPAPDDGSTLNRRGAQYVGRTFTLLEPIDNGYGTVQVDDTRWRVSGPPIEAGRAVRVTGVDGTVLQVEPA